jgi:CubicO group peptidase (beta-lactamase class C family)
MIAERVLLAVAGLVAACPHATAAGSGSAAVDRAMAEALKAWDVPGAALAVVRGDQTLILKGYGRKHADRPDPVTADTVFPLASCTKAFTTTLLAMFVDEGKIGWDDRARNHAPGFHLSDPHADALLTVRDLVSHRTGLGANDLLWYRAPWGVNEIIRRAEYVPLEYPFRSGFAYCSIPFLAAGRAVANAGKQPWEVLVRTRICAPLGMTGVTFTTKDISPSADRPGGHRKGKDGKVEPMPAYEMAEPNPSGSMNASARDLAAWVKFHLAGGVASGKRLVSEKNLRETRTPQTIIRLEGSVREMHPDTHQLSYAMGWLVFDHRDKLVVAHGGVIDGFRVQITLLPQEKLAFVVLSNLHETRMNQAVSNTLIDLYCGLPARDWNGYFGKVVAEDEARKRSEIESRNKARKPDTRPSLPLTGYANEYRDPAYGKAKVVADGGKLVLEWSSFRCSMEHFQDDTFRITDGYLEDRLVEFAVAPGRGAVALRLIGVVFKK